VSNVSIEQLGALHQQGSVKPAFVQNRCFARDGWDAEVRAFCRAQGIVYQGFSLLTANTRELARPAITQIARRTGRTPAQLVFRFAQQSGMLPLTGTTSAAHMEEDLACADLDLGPADLETLETIGI
jgi:diketogulonate reductase-like aldo/keto reductase